MEFAEGTQTYRSELMSDIFLSSFRPQNPFACVPFA